MTITNISSSFLIDSIDKVIFSNDLVFVEGILESFGEKVRCGSGATLYNTLDLRINNSTSVLIDRTLVLNKHFFIGHPKGDPLFSSVKKVGIIVC